jgi:hypothetical protein
MRHFGRAEIVYHWAKTRLHAGYIAQIVNDETLNERSGVGTETGTRKNKSL